MLAERREIPELELRGGAFQFPGRAHDLLATRPNDGRSRLLSMGVAHGNGSLQSMSAAPDTRWSMQVVRTTKFKNMSRRDSGGWRTLRLEDDDGQQSTRDEQPMSKWAKVDTSCHAVHWEVQENSFQRERHH